MARAGRKRKEGPRTASGQLSRAKEDRYIPLHLIREMAAKSARVGLYLTPLGRMALNERIDRAQFDAGMRFAEARRAADAALGLPARNVPAQDLAALHGHDGEDSEDARDRKRRDLDRWDKLLLVVGLNSAPLRALEWIVVYEREPEGHQQCIDLLKGLNMLARHWGLR